MPSESEVFQHARARLFDLRRQHEQQIREIDDALHAMETANKLLGGKPMGPIQVNSTPAPVRSAAPQNVGLTDAVREYIDSWQGEGAFNVTELVKWLQSRGMRGKYRTLYSSVHVILKKEAGFGRRLRYQKGIGFFKPKGEGVPQNVTG